MRKRSIGVLFLSVGSVLLLGGCATVPRYSYFQVPCSVPGAVPATQVAGSVQSPTATEDEAPVPTSGGVTAPSCIVAVSDGGYSPYDRAYYPRYGYYGYGRGSYGSSFGLGFGFGSHHSHHHSVGHHGGHIGH